MSDKENEPDRDCNVRTPPGQALLNFLPSLENYTSTFPDALVGNIIQNTGFDSADVRFVRLVSIAAQRFLSVIVNDALQHCKVRSSNQSSSSKSSNSNTNGEGGNIPHMVLTMDDLTPALAEHGMYIKKPPYYE